MAYIIIWPDLYREHGHWLPCVSLAETLRTAGHTVEFMGIPDCRTLAEPYGFSFREVLGDIYPLGHSAEDRLEPKGQRWKPQHLLPIASGVALGEIFDPTGGPRPELLISGYFNALETLLIHHRYRLPVSVITTYLRHPEDDPAMLAKTKLIYLPRALTRTLIDSVVQEPLEPPAVDPRLSVDGFVAPLEAQYPELLPCPAALDFLADRDWNHRQNVHYVEPMVVRPARADDTTESDHLGGDIPEPEPGEPPDLIFATVGSQVQDYEAKAKEFFRNLIAMMKTSDMGSYHLVLTVGSQIYADFTAEFHPSTGSTALPPNVSIYPWVDQQALLERTVVIYTHGGLASLKEAIWAEVPIVVVPHGKDQQDNALRMRRHHLGLVAQSRDLGPLYLRKLFTEASASRWIRRSLGKMRAVFAETETPTGGAPKPSLAPLQGALGSPYLMPTEPVPAPVPDA